MSTLHDGVRASIPAVCRLRRVDSAATAGTGILVASDLLLTSTAVFGGRRANDASGFVAVFFEGTKKRPIESRLQPARFFFAAEYPAYMDYCLVACEAQPVANITPVHLPLVRRQWATVDEGDAVLIVQHVIGGSYATHKNATAQQLRNVACEDATSGESLQRVCFEEVLRRRHDLMYLKTNGSMRTAGCPAFVDSGQLVGIQSQTQAEGEGVVSCILSVTAIVQHLFANRQLSHLSITVLAKDVWDTWHVDGDVVRLITIPCNFTAPDIAAEATRRLCTLANDTARVDDVVANDGVGMLVNGLQRFDADVDCVYQCLRALWHVGAHNGSALSTFVDERGVEVVCHVVEQHNSNAEIAQLAVLLLHNAVAGAAVTDEQMPHLTRIVYAAMQNFATAHIVQKFGAALLTRVVVQHRVLAHELVQHGVLAHISQLLDKQHQHVFVMEAVLHLLADLVQQGDTMKTAHADCTRSCSAIGLVDLVIAVMLAHVDNDSVLLHGNRALWGLGNDAHCRAAVLQNPRYVDAFRLSLPVLLTRSVAT